MIDTWQNASWKDRLTAILVVVAIVVGIWLCYLGTGFNWKSGHAANEYCRNEDYYVGDTMYTREICITPIPR
jgi:hypothetical protein